MKIGAGIAGLTAVVVILALTSCRQTPEALVQKAMAQSQSLLEHANVDGALAVLRQAYDDSVSDPLRVQLVGAMVSVNLSNNRIEAAQALFREVARRDPRLAAPMVGMIEERLMTAGRHDDLAAWCESLQASGLPEAALQAVADFHFKALDGAGRPGDVAKALPGYLARLPELAGLQLADRCFAAAMRAHATADAEAIVAALGTANASPARAGAVVRMRVDLLLAKGDRGAAEALFKQQAASLADDAASAILRRLVETADRDAADALCRSVLDSVKDRNALRATAAELWIAGARSRGAVAVVIERLTALRKDGFTASFLLGQMDRLYGFIMERGTKAEFGPLLELCQAIVPDLGDDDRGRVSGIMLDLCFYLERFDTALGIVEKGIPGHDAKWARTLSSKIRGHLYLQQGKPQEAVASFREFMADIAKEDADQIDPVKGTRVTKEMILGLNAKRIGDILAGAADAAGAAKAYQEARDYYQKALTSFGEKTAEYAKIKADLAAIPAPAAP